MSNPSIEQLTAIDAELSQLHGRMAELYGERNELVKNLGNSALQTTVETVKTPENWAEAEYQKVATAWDKYGIKVPAQEELQDKLNQAYMAKSQLEQANPELKDRLGLLLVPPTKMTGWPIKPSLRKKQGIAYTYDYINPNLEKPKANKEWRVLVADTTQDGIYLGSPQQIISDGSYKIAGKDTRGLGLAEYAALTLQAGEPIDKQTWTWLLKDWNSGQGAPNAYFIRGKFLFYLDYSGGTWDYLRFRPAVEV